MVSVQSLNDTLETMIGKHRSGEGATYEDIRDDMETLKSELQSIRKLVGETRTQLLGYAKASKDLVSSLDRLWKEASKAPTCRVKANEIRNNLNEKNKSVQRDVSKHIQRLEETTDLGSVESDLSELIDKLEENPYDELKQQVEKLDVGLKVLKRLMPHCSENKVVKALEQFMFLRGSEAPLRPEELAGYVEGLTTKQARDALDELVEKNCGLRAEFVLDLNTTEKGRVKNQSETSV